MISSLLTLAGSFIGSRLLSKNLTQKVHVVHAMPGRIRLQSNQWKGKEVSQSLESAFQGYALVSKVSASPVTGSLLLELKALHITTKQLDQLVQHAVNASVKAYPKKEATLLKSMKGIVNGVDSRIKTKSLGNVDLNSMLILFLFGKGLWHFKRNPTFSTGLLLWAYGLLSRGVEDND
jgi:hypothetical protein